MKFSCEKALLLSAINTAGRAVAAKSSIPALEGILAEADSPWTTVDWLQFGNWYYHAH